ncbi:papain-like cysteine protease family protein [Paraneptunicella aestuarii]|uniref:papain-like cysteine protease family protein n=1 Tax=Paraneptunicella aestuarii TaxID=2831148 RepID=UPI001E3E527A|nr:papain-like cysteine protease family protein [Paraneptunicella aestuarii]
MDTLGNSVDVEDLVKQLPITDKGVSIDKLSGVFQNYGVDAEFKRGLTIDDIASATQSGTPVIVAVRQGGGGHAIVVDGITTRQGVDVVAIRDPWGTQYFEKLTVFKKRFLRQGVIINSGG